MVIVDTSVWIDFFRNLQNPQTLWLDRELSRHRLAITDLVLCELLQGSKTPENVSSPHSSDSFVFSLQVVRALVVANNFRFLRREGFTIRGTIDCCIATFSMREGHRLLHSDRAFDVFERELGLAVVKT